MMKNILQNTKGFTMIELLVALAIFSVVIIGVIEVFGNSYKSYVVQDEVVDLQQSLRTARSFIEQDLRMTGSGIGDNFFFLGGYNFQGEGEGENNPEPIVPIIFENGGEGESDKLTINYINWGTGCGEAPTGTTLSACDNLPILHLVGAGMPVGSSIFNVKEDLSDDLYTDWDSGCYCGGKTYPSPKLGFMAIITDAQNASRSDVVIITQVNPNNNNQVQNQANATYDLNGDGTIDNKTEKFDNKVANSFSDNSTIQFFHPEFAVAATYELTTDGTLLRNNVPIADNIEDLQFAFCGDFDGDNTADCPQDITKGEWKYKDADLDGGDLKEADRNAVRFIHISLLGRTAKPHSKDLTSKRPELGDRKAGDSDDPFRRRLLQTTIQLRNMNL